MRFVFFMLTHIIAYRRILIHFLHKKDGKTNKRLTNKVVYHSMT